MRTSSRSKEVIPPVIPVVGARSVRSLATLIRAGGSAKKHGPSSLAIQRQALTKAVQPLAYTRRERATMLSRAQLDLKRLVPLKEFTLSVRETYLDGSGELYFFNVSDYISEQDRAALFMSNLGGGSIFSVIVHSNAAGARTCWTYRYQDPPACVWIAFMATPQPLPTAKGTF